jgi:hypothetical protein
MCCYFQLYPINADKWQAPVSRSNCISMVAYAAFIGNEYRYRSPVLNQALCFEGIQRSSGTIQYIPILGTRQRSGLLHSLVLSPGKKSVALNKIMCAPQSPLDALKEKKKVLHPAGNWTMSPWSSITHPSLYWLSYPGSLSMTEWKFKSMDTFCR